jgi:integrase
VRARTRRWRGHLDKLLPARAKVRKVEHHAALPYNELPNFMKALRAQEGIAARALEFAILTAARTGEVIGARWVEIDIDEKLWTVPAVRMKADKEHRVPLSARAVAILEEMKPLCQVSGGQNEADAFVFPGGRHGQPLSNMAFLMLLRRMKWGDLTAHGFRSTFRDWAAERTNFPSEVAEMALAHAVGEKVEAAYRRGDLLERRRRMMTSWATFCANPKEAAPINVGALRQATDGRRPTDPPSASFQKARLHAVTGGGDQGRVLLGVMIACTIFKWVMTPTLVSLCHNHSFG